jgi:5-formyltetrahydrofolate cyclo-ligase
VNKSEVRAEVRGRLRALSAAQREQWGEEIAARVWSVPRVAGARALLLYASLPGEVPTDAIAHEALRRGIIVTYPRCLPETRAMTLHSLSALDELESSSYGIREPRLACPRLETAEIDVALVPGLAWDRKGGRLGRGAGYYDRLFASPEWRGFRCGVFFSIQEVPTVPTDPWDLPLHAVVTDREVTYTDRLPTPSPT